jgi:hypothetical protein
VEEGSVGLWTEYGETSLTFLEYQLVGVASDLFPDTLLNTEGGQLTWLRIYSYTVRLPLNFCPSV